MARHLMVGAAQLGPIARQDTRRAVVTRLISLMREAHSRGCDLVSYPELALTTFFPRWLIEDEGELDRFYEKRMPSPSTQPLFDEARRLQIGFVLGYAELVERGGQTHRYNTSILVDKRARVIGKYRKIHLPGTEKPVPGLPAQHLERRYFEMGTSGFQTWTGFGGVIGLCICSDRRWPETYRMLRLRGAEMVTLGYNTPIGIGEGASKDLLAPFQNHLAMQAGAYQNSLWVIGVAKCGREEGVDMIGQSAVIAPSGEIVAMCRTLDDELVSYRCDLDAGRQYRDGIFNFEIYRQPAHYDLIANVEGREALPAVSAECS